MPPAKFPSIIETANNVQMPEKCVQGFETLINEGFLEKSEPSLHL